MDVHQLRVVAGNRGAVGIEIAVLHRHFDFERTARIPLRLVRRVLKKIETRQASVNSDARDSQSVIVGRQRPRLLRIRVVIDRFARLWPVGRLVTGTSLTASGVNHESGFPS